MASGAFRAVFRRESPEGARLLIITIRLSIGF